MFTPHFSFLLLSSYINIQGFRTLIVKLFQNSNSLPTITLALNVGQCLTYCLVIYGIIKVTRSPPERRINMEQTTHKSKSKVFLLKHKSIFIAFVTLISAFLLQNIFFDLILFSFNSLLVVGLLFILLIIVLKSIKWIFRMLIGLITLYTIFALLVFLASL